MKYPRLRRTLQRGSDTPELVAAEPLPGFVPPWLAAGHQGDRRGCAARRGTDQRRVPAARWGGGYSGGFGGGG